MDLDYTLGTLLALPCLWLVYVIVQILYEIVQIVLDTVKICEYIRENPDKVTASLTVENREIPRVVGLRGKYNKDREDFLDKIDESHKRQDEKLEEE